MPRRFGKPPDSKGILVLNATPGVKKMSAVILDFAQPWLAEARDDQDAHDILGVAVLAWNLSLLSPPECERQFQELLVPKLGRQHQIIVRKMITRRRTHFANHYRQVLDYVIGSKGNQLNLEVLSTL